MPKQQAVQNLFAYWLINIPLGLVLAWPLKLSYYGLWIGITVAQFYLSIAMHWLIETVDWQQVAD